MVQRNQGAKPATPPVTSPTVPNAAQAAAMAAARANSAGGNTPPLGRQGGTPAELQAALLGQILRSNNPATPIGSQPAQTRPNAGVQNPVLNAALQNILSGAGGNTPAGMQNLQQALNANPELRQQLLALAANSNRGNQMK